MIAHRVESKTPVVTAWPTPALCQMAHWREADQAVKAVRNRPMPAVDGFGGIARAGD
jgi:hypothetical protein